MERISPIFQQRGQGMDVCPISSFMFCRPARFTASYFRLSRQEGIVGTLTIAWSPPDAYYLVCSNRSSVCVGIYRADNFRPLLKPSCMTQLLNDERGCHTNFVNVTVCVVIVWHCSRMLFGLFLVMIRSILSVTPSTLLSSYSLFPSQCILHQLLFREHVQSRKLSSEPSGTPIDCRLCGRGR